MWPPTPYQRRYTTEPIRIRPAAPAVATSPYVLFNKINEVQAGSPTTVKQVLQNDGTSAKTKSVTNGVYSDTQAILLKLQSPVSIKLNSPYGLDVGLQNSATASVTASITNSKSPGDCGLFVRARTIKTNYDPTTVTWNDYLAFTFGFQFGPGASSTSTANSDAFSEDTLAATVAVSHTNSVNGKVAITPTALGDGAYTIYGVALEIAPVWYPFAAVDIGIAVLNSITCEYSKNWSSTRSGQPISPSSIFYYPGVFYT